MIFKQPNIVNEVKIKKLEWVESMVEKVLQENPRGEKPLGIGQAIVGKLELRWPFQIS